MSQEQINYSGSGLVFVNTYDSTVTPDYRNAIIAAENFFQAHFNNAATINLSFSTRAMPGDVAQNQWTTPLPPMTLTAMESVLGKVGDTFPFLPTDPTHGQAVWLMSPAEEKALGLLSPTATGSDGTIWLNNSLSYFYNGIPVNGENDAISAIEHELPKLWGGTVL